VIILSEQESTEQVQETKKEKKKIKKITRLMLAIKTYVFSNLTLPLE
jgi:hypothetical protein